MSARPEVPSRGDSRGSLSSTSPEAEALLASCIDRLNAGERIDLERLVAEHPTVGPAVARQLRLFEGAPEAPAPAPAGALGKLGDFTLQRQLGRGGMGVVYEAWEGSMDRRVALKVLPPGFAADERALQRFVREAKTAGQLHHPSVVSVYGMGLKEQTPYYAMELVEGETLAQILARWREGLLPEAAAAAAAELAFGCARGEAGHYASVARAFAGVAEGLHHAHASGIVHRDIKPSNLILDRQGSLRILDFGLAQLEGQEGLTATSGVVGTPLYMSPEQARARKNAIDHRTDIYSTGATLYEVLSLRPPFRGKSTQDTLSQIIASDPAPLRKLDARVPRDLETIVLKCLRKEPADRYATAEALAQDLRRFVRGEAVEARPQTRFERFSRRLWRRRWLVLAAAAALLVLVAGLASGLYLVSREKRRTEEALGAARADFRSAVEAVDEFLTQVAEEDLAVVPGMEATRRKFLESAQRFYESALREKGPFPGIRERLGLAHQKLGKLQMRTGDRERSEASLRQSISILEALAAEAPAQKSFRYNLAESQTLLADLLVTAAGRREEAQKLLEAALATRETLAKEAPENVEYQRDVAAAHNNLAKAFLASLRAGGGSETALRQAREHLLRAAALARDIVGAHADDEDSRALLAVALGNAALISGDLGDFAAADAAYRESIETGRKLVVQFPAATDYRKSLADHLLNHGNLLRFELKRPQDGEASFREALAICDGLAADFPQTPAHASQVGEVLNNIAQMVKDRGELAEARQLLDRAIESQERAIQSDPGDQHFANDLANHWGVMAEVREKSGDIGGAAEACRKSMAILERLATAEPDAVSLLEPLAFYQRQLGGLLRQLGDGEAAAEADRKELALLEKLAAAVPQEAAHRRSLARALFREGMRRVQAAKAAGETPGASPPEGSRELLERAIGEQEKALELAAPRPADRRTLCDYVAGQGNFLLDYRDLAGAEARFKSLEGLLEPLVKDASAPADLVEMDAMARSQRAVALARLGRAEESEAAYAGALAAEERLVAREPANGSFHNHLGDMWKELSELREARGDLAGARACAEKAVVRYEEAMKLKPGYERYVKDLEEGQKLFERLNVK